MNLLQTIINYYHGEARHGFWAAVIGGLLLIGGIVLWKWASPLSLLKGFAVPMFLFGLLMGVGGGADNIYTNKTAPLKIALYQKDSTTFLKQEKLKTEKTHSGWRRIRVFWGVLGLSGLILSLLMSKPFWIGAGLGTVALAIILSLFEFYSMRFNERYYHAIQSVADPKVSANVQEINTAEQPQIKTQQTHAGSSLSEQKNVKPEINARQQNIITRDSLKPLPATDITGVRIIDSVNFATSYDLKLPVPANEVSQISSQEKGMKKKVLDYYNSDLIQANSVNARHCLFSKKYIKN